MGKVVIVDYGSQYTQLIARKIRDLRVFSEVVTASSDPNLEDLSGLILSGGPFSVYDPQAPGIPLWIKPLLEKRIPILGICYGFQLLTKYFGGRVDRAHSSEYGRMRIEIQRENPLFDKIDHSFSVWMSHGDSVLKLPAEFVLSALSQNELTASAFHENAPIYGLQFHPEVNHTEFGERIFGNFLFNICGCAPDWTLKDFLATERESLRAQIGSQGAVCGVSGGVDSTVAAVLTHQAIGSQLTGVFVDTGLLRKNEEIEVPDLFRRSFGLNLRVVDARKEFFGRLAGVTDPEDKRKIIGETFIRVFESEARKIGSPPFLVQGTIYSDVIESAGTQGGGTIKIKSHHNVGGLPQQMDFSIVEPLRFLFKDEVRRAGSLLNIPAQILNRHPFPGPGLAIRCLGEVTPDRIRVLKDVDALFLHTLREYGWYEKVWQAFAVLLPLKSVGVAGDQRAYGNVVALRSVDSVEAMTADWSRIPYDILDEAARRIINRVAEVGRVVYDITGKPPATIEWE